MEDKDLGELVRSPEPQQEEYFMAPDTLSDSPPYHDHQEQEQEEDEPQSPPPPASPTDDTCTPQVQLSEDQSVHVDQTEADEVDSDDADGEEEDIETEDGGVFDETMRSPEGGFNETVTNYSPPLTEPCTPPYHSSDIQPTEPLTPEGPSQAEPISPEPCTPEPRSPSPEPITPERPTEPEPSDDPRTPGGPSTPEEPSQFTETYDDDDDDPRTPPMTSDRPMTPSNGPQTPTGPSQPERMFSPQTPPSNVSGDQSFESNTSEECVPPFEMTTENLYISASKYVFLNLFLILTKYLKA